MELSQVLTLNYISFETSICINIKQESSITTFYKYRWWGLNFPLNFSRMSNKMGEGASTLVQVASSVPFNSREESMTLRSGLRIKFLPVPRRLPQERGEREREVSFMQMCSRSLINWGSWLSFLRLSELLRASLASALYSNFWPLFSVQPKR